MVVVVVDDVMVWVFLVFVIVFLGINSEFIVVVWVFFCGIVFIIVMFIFV